MIKAMATVVVQCLLLEGLFMQWIIHDDGMGWVDDGMGVCFAG